MYLTAFGRPPAAEEAERAAAYVEWSRRESGRATVESAGAAGFASPWADLAHALFNAKEFIYLR